MKVFALRIVLCIVFLSSVGTAQILRFTDLTSTQIAKLDRARTVVLIPGGILEEHGPYLPVYTDGYADRYYTEQLATSLARTPGWTIVVFPEIPLGFCGANCMGAKWNFPGSVTVRLATFRAIYMDLASSLGEQGFRWIFVVHDHGDPAHNRALTQVSAFFHDTYGGTMVHLFGLTTVNECYDTVAKVLDKKAAEEDGFTVHAGAGEHSQILFLHPELIDAGYKSAMPLTASTFEDLYSLAAKPDWPGYYGSPRQASAALGKAVMTSCAAKMAQVSQQIIGGLDPATLPRFYDQLDPRDAIGDKTERAHDRELAQKQVEWLSKHQIE
ncbi:creatininase family protein [Occallatibacter savannae]|uniref:creatininase family protein n=1 Tax=Occallatibacter savannae TaxID=1002691 RepID=UPI0013A5A1E9|nr:creatininase family protein [Occallatibacter savannae]